MKTIPTMIHAALTAAALAGCATIHLPVAVDEDEMTYDDYDDRTDFGSLGPNDADPPIYVHDFDTDLISQNGGKQLSDGDEWLNASDSERNQMLVDARSKLGPDDTLMLVVATGELWSIGPGSGPLVFAGKLREWSWDDYDDLSEYYLAPARMPAQLTLSQYMSISAIGPMPGLPEPYYIHDLGQIGLQEIKSAQGFQVITPDQWLHMTPLQRADDLTEIYNFIKYMPQFQGEGNKPVMGVSVSWGATYAVPQHNYDNLLGWHAIQPWNSWQILALPTVPPGSDHPIRDIKPFVRLDLDTKF